MNKFLEPFIAAGPQWSWNIGDRNFIIDGLNAVNGEYGDYTLRKSSLSLNLGLGAVILDHVQVAANYNIALGSTSDYSNSILMGALNNYDRIKSKTNTWQISVAYIF